MNAPLTPQDWEFLSTYLDGQLSPAEARRAQDVLARRPELGPALDELRRTRAVLRAASRRRAPRNFTLTPAMARQARPRSWFHFGWAPSLRFTSALATLLLVLSFFVRLPATGLPAAPLAAQAPMAAQADGFAAQEKAAANEASVPPIIIWNDGGRGAAGLGAGDSPAGALPRDLVLPQATPAGPQVGTTNNDATQRPPRQPGRRRRWPKRPPPRQPIRSFWVSPPQISAAKCSPPYREPVPRPPPPCRNRRQPRTVGFGCR